MGASIHISGTGSSTVDTVFVCRSTGSIKGNHFNGTESGLRRLLNSDVEALRRAELEPSLGDVFCLLLGHIARIAVWELRPNWSCSLPMRDKLERVRAKMEDLCPIEGMEKFTKELLSAFVPRQRQLLESFAGYQADETVSF